MLGLDKYIILGKKSKEKNKKILIFISMRKLLIILPIILLASCGSYRIQTIQPQVTHVMAITNTGDTIQVPIQEFQRKLTPQDYPGWNIYWNNSWWIYNDWYWNYWSPNPRLFTPRYYIYTPRTRVSTPRYVTRHFDNRPNPPIVREPQRGRSNQTSPRVQQDQPRVQQPTRTPQRTQPTIRQQQTPKTTRGGVIIKQ